MPAFEAPASELSLAEKEASTNQRDDNRRRDMQSIMRLSLGSLVAGIALMGNAVLSADNPATVVKIDANADRHEIDPRIYGLAFATEAQLIVELLSQKVRRSTAVRQMEPRFWQWP
jgi:hypothetical protein